MVESRLAAAGPRWPGRRTELPLDRQRLFLAGSPPETFWRYLQQSRPPQAPGHVGCEPDCLTETTHHWRLVEPSRAGSFRTYRGLSSWDRWARR